jgi:hypothetical protein
MTNATAAQTVFSQPFEIKPNRNIRISASAPVSNSFAELYVDLVNEQSQEVESVNIPIEYYFGSDSDGSWTEGSKDQDATLVFAGWKIHASGRRNVAGLAEADADFIEGRTKRESRSEFSLRVHRAFDRASTWPVQKILVRVEPLEGQYVYYE